MRWPGTASARGEDATRYARFLSITSHQNQPVNPLNRPKESDTYVPGSVFLSRDYLC